MSKPQVNYVDPETWANTVAILVMGAVEQVCHARGSCSVMLTGGRSAERLYQAWGGLPQFKHLHCVQFYFGDERCVPPDHPESNYGMVMRTLFRDGVPKECTVFRMKAEAANRAAAAADYDKGLPNIIDIMLLSVGEDGHVASLFPESSALNERYACIVPVWAPKLPHERLTVSPLAIARCMKVFVMALGSAKAEIFHQAQQDPLAIAALPVRMVLNGIWILDKQ